MDSEYWRSLINDGDLICDFTRYLDPQIDRDGHAATADRFMQERGIVVVGFEIRCYTAKRNTCHLSNIYATDASDTEVRGKTGVGQVLLDLLDYLGVCLKTYEKSTFELREGYNDFIADFRTHKLYSSMLIDLWE